MTSVNADPLVLSIARRILERHKFLVEERQAEGLENATWLLAESEYFVLGVAAGKTFDDLVVLEGFVADSLSRVVSEGSIGAKRWDSYVVLLASSDADQRGRPGVVRLQYNTRALRRLVSLGVGAHEDAVAAALSTFLPIPDPPAGGLPSPFDDLVEQLTLNGVPEEQAAAAVANYRGSGGVGEA
jgi:hypothetical protein